MTNAQRIPLSSLDGGTILTSGFVPARDATAFVYQHGTTTQVNVYLTETSATLMAQPLTADNNGQLPGWVASGQDLDLVASFGGVTAAPVLIEPDVASGGGRVALSSPDGTVVIGGTMSAPTLDVASAVVNATPSAVVEGVNLYGFGNSYLAVAPPICVRRYWERDYAWLRSGTTPTPNRGVSSSIASDISNFVHSSFTQATASGTVPGTWTPSPSNRGLVIWEGIRNDAGWDGISAGNTAKSRAGFVNGLDSFLRLIRAQSAIQDTATGAFAFTGTWTSSANIHVSGGNSHNTTTPGDKVTVTTPVGTDFDLILLGGDVAITGSAFTVSVDGADITAQLAAAGYPTSTKFQLDQAKQISTAPWVPLAVPLRGLSSQAHTVVLTHAGSAGDALFVCRLLTPSPTPPTVLMHKANQLGTGTNTGYNSYVSLGNRAGSPSWATDQIYNGLMETVVARFGALSALGAMAKATPDQSIVIADPMLNGWAPSMVSTGDASGVHPGDTGMTCYASLDRAAMNLLSSRNGLILP